MYIFFSDFASFIIYFYVSMSSFFGTVSVLYCTEIAVIAIECQNLVEASYLAVAVLVESKTCTERHWHFSVSTSETYGKCAKLNGNRPKRQMLHRCSMCSYIYFHIEMLIVQRRSQIQIPNYSSITQAYIGCYRSTSMSLQMLYRSIIIQICW